jgi:hypothetical protein
VSHRTIVVGVVAAALAISCTALAGATSERTANATVARRVITVQGRPFFPVMLIDQCTREAAAHARRLGINLILNESCAATSPARQLTMLARKQLAVLPIQQRKTRGSKLVGWTYPDEPDNNGWTPETLARSFPYKRGNRDGLLTFVTTTGRFFRPPYRDTRVSPAVTGQFARLADVAGFDLYPLNACQHDLSAVYDAQRQFVRLAGKMPTFQWIETGPIVPTYCGGFEMQPEELRAEVWLAIAGGARGIGYFTHTWSPEHSTFDVRPPLVDELRRTNAQLRRLSDALLGDAVAAGSDTGAIKLAARSAGGRVYVFAVNSTREHVKAQLEVPELGSGGVVVYEESRTLPARDGIVIDGFAPLAVHVYVGA